MGFSTKDLNLVSNATQAPLAASRKVDFREPTTHEWRQPNGDDDVDNDDNMYSNYHYDSNSIDNCYNDIDDGDNEDTSNHDNDYNSFDNHSMT